MQKLNTKLKNKPEANAIIEDVDENNSSASDLFKKNMNMFGIGGNKGISLQNSVSDS